MIYEKLNAARDEFHTLKLEKTGLNKFAGYKYFELGDFLIPALRVFRNHGLCAFISFTAELATLTIATVDGKETMVITSPMSEAALKGAHAIQNLGAVQTYLRRYLWVAALEIVEHDAVDSSQGKETRAPRHTATNGALVTDDKRSMLADVATAIHDHINDGDEIGAYEEYSGVTDVEEKTALWGMLSVAARKSIKQTGEKQK